MTDDYKHLQNLGICLLVLAALAFVAYFVAPAIKPVEDSGLDASATAQGLRFLFMGLGALGVLGVCYATRDNPAWEIEAQKIVYMAVGAVLYGVLLWLFDGELLKIPALSQVPLRPAVVMPVLFGALFGPVVGFVAGAGGFLIGDLFVGLVSPHWILAHGIIGLCGGLPMLFDDKRQAWDAGSVITGIGGIVAAAFFLANPGIAYAPPPEFKPVTLTLFLGLSVVLGCGLAIAVRFAFPNRPQWGQAAVWGAAGIVVGTLLASIADIWVENLGVMDAVVGKFIPSAGPGLIALAILTPLLLAINAAAGRTEG